MLVHGVDFADAVARCFAPEAVVGLRLETARGALPLPPVQRLVSLVVLAADPAEEVRAAARDALAALPDAFLFEALGDPSLPGVAVDLAAGLGAERPQVLWRALEHPALESGTVERHLGSADPEVVSRLAHNQRFFDRNPELARRLLESPLLAPAEKSRLAFLYGGPGDDPLTVPLEDVALPEDLPPELLEDAPETASDDSRQNLYQFVQTLSVAEKIKLAMLGSKGARRLLIRDTNRIVSVAVIRSPKIREDEVTAIAQDRTIADEILRIILNRKDWLKNYPLRLALCENPKTPIPRAIRLLETLQEKDLRQIAKSRNVQGAVSTTALRILARRGKT